MKKLFLTFCALISMCVITQAQATTAPVTCGTKTIDLVIMMDRTGSVSTTARAAEAAAAKSLLDTFINLNAGHKVAIGAFNNDVSGGAQAQIVASLSTDYVALKTAVTNAMNHSAAWTNIEDAISVSQNELQTNGTNTAKIIVLISDGGADKKTTSPVCDAGLNFNSYECAAYKAAETAKAAGIRIITVSYDASSSSTTDVKGRKLLAAMASQPS
ncbi:MAG: hypothetical protein ACD_73C00802G0001, partial [uncultured bacterium]